MRSRRHRWAARLRVGLACMVVVGSGCSDAASSDDATAEVDPGELRAFLERYAQAFERGDTAAIRASYIADERFAILEDGEHRYGSPDDVLAGVAALPVGTTLATTYGEPTISALAPGVVAVVAEFSTSMTGEAFGAYTFSGVMSLVLERGVDGWRIVSGHTSTARPDEWRN